uniref:ATP-dependent DNA helicase n=1 Tax=Aegilops tauschii subsp. strangulata TaxID=200361 RepID=A0A453GWE2_AEGTS
MTKRQAVETLDRSLQDIMECSLPFGGKVVVFGGDFRQVLPVVTRGTRAQADPWFSEYLLRIGNGTEETIGDDYVRLPEDIVIGYTEDEKAINMLIEDVFPSLQANARSREYMSARAILSTKNDHVDDLNDKMISRFPGEEKLKVNCPVILLRNLDPHNGLCNGTRLMIRAFQDNAIDAEIVGGQHAGKRVFIPRIPMSPSEDISLPFKLKRKQFPIRLSFAMTINKAQGQTIPNVGIYLPEPVFSHGQLYVALSRGVSRETTRILAKPNKDVDKSGKST